MKGFPSQNIISCQQQLSDAQHLNIVLQQTVMNLQEALQQCQGSHKEKDIVIATQREENDNLKTEGHIKDRTIEGLTLKSEQQEIIIDKQNHIVADQLHRLAKNKSDLFDYKMLRYQWMQLRKMIYGRRSEKRYVDITAENKNTTQQPTLFEVDADHEGVVHLKDAKKIRERTVVVKEIKNKVPHPGRYELPEWMERRIVKTEQEIPEGAVLIGVERTERLACSGMHMWVNVEERDIYMIKVDDSGKSKQIIAPLAAHPIPKCKADISLLVTLVIEKYLYHMPLYRQRQRFGHYGIDLKYNTLSNWVSSTIDVLEPLWKLLLHELTISGYIHCDETRYRVLDESKKKGKRSHNGYLWAVGNTLQRIVYFTYKKGRGKVEVKDILSGFRGYLHTDGYSGYDKYGQQPGVIHLNCMDHARRYFTDSADNDQYRSNYALDLFFGPLYAIERECREQGLSYDEITEVRQTRSVPVLNQLRDWLTIEINQVIEGTPVYTAMAYTLKRIKHLMIYTTDGMLSMSNMFIEQSIRPVKVGLKNYLFAGSHRHGERAAIIYSLIETCKLHGIDPAKWLADVLPRINDDKQNKLSELLPQNWKPKPQVKTITSATA